MDRRHARNLARLTPTRGAVSPVDRRKAGLLGALLLVVLIACGDPYLHTNPYDPVFPVAITISGPETLYSQNQYATYTALTVPSFPDTAVQWIADNTYNFRAAGSGTFQSFAPPLEPATVTVTVEALIGSIDTTVSRNYITVTTNAYRHIQTKTVVLTQHVTHIQLRCPDTHACDTLSAGDAWSVWVDGFDALNQRIVALTSSVANPPTGTPVATFAVRDTTVASVVPVGIRAATVTALKPGTTWVVATRGSLLDSLQLQVH